jgi:hypothetical protein
VYPSFVNEGYKEEHMAERMTEEEFVEVLHKMLTHGEAAGLSAGHYIRGVIPIRDHAGIGTSEPGLIVTLNNGAEFEVSVRKRQTG